MWPWIKRWRDWAMNELWPLFRLGPQPQALHFSYEKAGLTIHDQPIPWNAEAVLIDALVKADFVERLNSRNETVVELRGALEQLGEMVGAVYTDDLLDRVFSRFCIGK